MAPQYEKLQEKVKLLERELKKLEKENNLLSSKISMLMPVIAKLKEENKRLKDENKRLTALLRKYVNENTPSGAIPPHLKEKMDKKKREVNNASKPPYHRAANIRNRREKKYDTVETHEADMCPYCGGELVERKKIVKRVVIQLEVPKAENVLHESKTYYCKKCDKTIIPTPKDVLPNSKFDLNIHLLVVFLFVLNMTQRKIRDVLLLFGVNASEASINNMIHRMQRYLGDRKYKQLEKGLRKASVAYMDETGWRHKGKTHWMWVVTNAKTVFYKIEKSRGHSVAERLPSGKVNVADGYRAYDKLGKEIQRCWAHLFRRLFNPPYYFTSEEEVEEYNDFVDKLTGLYKKAIKVKNRCKKVRKMFDRKLRDLLLIPRKRGKNLDSIRDYIARYENDWFTFLEYKGVEPTNNRAERMLRPVVIKRKISQHTWSTEGKKGLAVLYSIYETSKLRKENFIDILRNEVRAGVFESGKI